MFPEDTGGRMTGGLKPFQSWLLNRIHVLPKQTSRKSMHMKKIFEAAGSTENSDRNHNISLMCFLFAFQNWKSRLLQSSQYNKKNELVIRTFDKTMLLLTR